MPLSNIIDFGNGEFQRAAGANDAIYIDGLIPYNDNCLHGGTQDFLYPATDVYIVPAGSASSGAKLTDVNGTPNTIVATSTGVFVGEMIAVTTPSGSLGAGDYDVVYDNCQDGTVDPEDAVWPDAISVTIPAGDLPPVSNSIRQIKEAARVQYVSWIQNQMALKALFLLEQAESWLSCLLAPGLECASDFALGLFGVTDLVSAAKSRVEDQVLALVVNQTKNYAAIWQDPPDPAFDQLPRSCPNTSTRFRRVAMRSRMRSPRLASRSPRRGARPGVAACARALSGRSGGGQRRVGARAGRAVAQLSDDLATALRTSTAVTDLRDTVAANADSLAADSVKGAAVVNRIRTTGLSPDERRGLLNRGYTDEQIRQFESRYVAAGQASSQDAHTILAPFEELVAARDGMADTLDESAASWTALAAELDSRVDAPLPSVDAGGPYTAGVDGALSPVATVTTPDGSTITAIDWDTDGDGEFDDASGPNPSITLDRSRTISVRVTNDAGWQAVDFAVVNVASEPTPAATATPSDHALTLARWRNPAVDRRRSRRIGLRMDHRRRARGRRRIVRVQGHPRAGRRPRRHRHRHPRPPPDRRDMGCLGRAARRRWRRLDGRRRVRRHARRRPSRHVRTAGQRPRRRLRSGTPDSPPGGLTGEVWSWGNSGGTGRSEATSIAAAGRGAR